MNYAALENNDLKYPDAPTSISGTGIASNSLLRLLIKIIYVQNLELASEIANVMKLERSVVNDLFDEALDQKLLESKGSYGNDVRSEIRYSLTSTGKEWTIEAMALSQYIGPAPVSIDNYYQQVNNQLIMGERVEKSVIQAGLSDYVVPENLVRQLGQATNSGRAMLLYGEPGNGKTTIAEIIG